MDRRPTEVIAKLCSYHDYTTLTPTMLSDRLARIVMEPVRREQVLERTRAIVRRNLPRLESWIHSHDDIFSYIPPVAGAITFFRYKLPISSAALFDRLRKERSVLITPGDHFGVGRYIRVGFGYDVDYTLRGLARVDLTLEELKKKSGRSKAVGGESCAPRRCLVYCSSQLRAGRPQDSRRDAGATESLARSSTRVAAATSCTPTPVRSQTMISSSEVRPGFRPAVISPNSA